MKAPAFQFYPNDFLASSTVRLMAAQEVGAYILLLSHAWQSSRPGCLPNCEDRLRRLSTLTPKQWHHSRTIILGKFPEIPGEPEWRYNPRLIQEVEKQAIRRARLSTNGRMGGRPPKELSTIDLDGQHVSERAGDSLQKQKLFVQKPLVSETKANAKPFNFNSIFPTSIEVESAAPSASRPRRSKQPFAVPLLEQIQTYAVEAFPTEPLAVEEAVKFFHHFESNGWRVGGKSPMIKWQPSFQSWMRRCSQFNSSPGSPAGSPGTPSPMRAQIAPKSASGSHRYS